MAALPPILCCAPEWNPPAVGGDRPAAHISEFSGRRIATCHDLNPLAAPGGDPPGFAPGIHILWSGWSAPDETGLATWGASGWRDFCAWCDGVGPTLEGRAEIWFRPHARHALSDTPRCAGFLRGRAGQPFGLLLDPIGMLAASMLADATDHLERMVGALAPLPGVRGMLLTNVALDARGQARACPIDRGLVPLGVLAGLVARCWPADRPLVLTGPDASAQAAALSAALA